MSTIPEKRPTFAGKPSEPLATVLGRDPDAEIEPEQFRAEIERLRMVEGYTVEELVEITRNPRLTLFSWITGGAVPDQARMRRFVRDMNHPRTPVSAVKLSANHLAFDRQKRKWIVRFTVDMGAKVVGKRIKYLCAARDVRGALLERNAVHKTLELCGLTVRPRIQKRKGDA